MRSSPSRLPAAALAAAALATISVTSPGAALAATATVSFQNGVDGYTGTFDRRVSSSANRHVNGASVTNVFADGFEAPTGDPPTGGSPDDQPLMRFDNIFGSGPGQVPLGATILSSQLTLTTPTDVGNAQTGAPFGVSRLLKGFNESTVYTDFSPEGPNLRSATSTRTVDSFVNRNNPPGNVNRINVGDVVYAEVGPIVRAWSAGAENHGFAVQQTRPAMTTDGWAFRTTGHTVATDRPKLSVTYTTDPVTTVSFQQGKNGYSAGRMLFVKEDQTYSETERVDGTGVQGALDGASSTQNGTQANSRDNQVFIKFAELFGTAQGQVPADATIVSAKLVVRTADAAIASQSRTAGRYEAREVLVDWDADPDDPSKPTYFSEFGGGLGPSAGAVGPTVGSSWGMTTDSEAYFDVTSVVQSWKDGKTPNYGFDIASGNTIDGWNIYFNGEADVNLRPELQVSYIAVPEPASLALGLASVGGFLLRRRRRDSRMA